MGRGFEDCYFVLRPKTSSGFVSLFPPLVGLENVNPTNAIEVTPYATSKAEFLVHDWCPWEAIEVIGVIDQTIAARVLTAIAGAGHKPRVEVHRDWYY